MDRTYEPVRARQVAALWRARDTRLVHVLPVVEMVGRVIWDAKLAAARAALRARVLAEWARDGVL